MITRVPADYLLVETQVGATSDRFLGDAIALVKAGERVFLVLVADAVGSAICGQSPLLAELLRMGAQVWVDDFTLAQRALTAAPLAPGIAPVPIRQVVDRLLVDGTRVVWH